MARIIYPRTGLTGGTTTDLDGIDGDSLNDGDRCHVFAAGILYSYLLDDDSGATESSPYVISPDTNAGTKRWILQQAPWLDDTGNVFYNSNQVRDPQRMLWNQASEIMSGIKNDPVSSGTPMVAAFRSFTTSQLWAALNAFAVSQVASDDVYQTVLNVASGSGIVSHLVLPGVTSASDTVTLLITLDGNELGPITFTADNATDRFFACLTDQHGSTYAQGENVSHSVWNNMGVNGGLAIRRSDSDLTTVMVEPGYAQGNSPCLRFMDSIKIEMKSSDVSTTNYRDYCAAVYTLDQY